MVRMRRWIERVGRWIRMFRIIDVVRRILVDDEWRWSGLVRTKVFLILNHRSDAGNRH